MVAPSHQEGNGTPNALGYACPLKTQGAIFFSNVGLY